MEINKGNYGIDTDDRFKKYMSARAFGNEEAFYQYRENWEDYPKQKIVSEYPLSLEFQISDVCNLKCPFCYRGQPDYVQSKKGFMDFSLFQKAMDEVKGNVPAIRFNSTGESVLHPQFLDMIKYAKDCGAIEVSFVTNLGAVSLDMFEKMLIAGVDWMTVSIDGIYEAYEKNRYPLKFNDIYNKMVEMNRIKKKHNTPKPAINIQGIWPYIEKDIDEYLSLMAECCDYVNYGAYIDMASLSHNCDFSLNEPGFVCPEPYQRLYIQLDGSVSMCCGCTGAATSKPIGDLYTESVYDIWHGTRMGRIRDLCSTPDGYKSIDKCQKCFKPRAMKEKEVYIKGEKRIILEYV